MTGAFVRSRFTPTSRAARPTPTAISSSTSSSKRHQQARASLTTAGCRINQPPPRPQLHGPQPRRLPTCPARDLRNVAYGVLGPERRQHHLLRQPLQPDRAHWTRRGLHRRCAGHQSVMHLWLWRWRTLLRRRRDHNLLAAIVSHHRRHLSRRARLPSPDAHPGRGRSGQSGQLSEYRLRKVSPVPPTAHHSGPGEHTSHAQLRGWNPVLLPAQEGRLQPHRLSHPAGFQGRVLPNLTRHPCPLCGTRRGGQSSQRLRVLTWASHRPELPRIGQRVCHNDYPDPRRATRRAPRQRIPVPRQIRGPRHLPAQRRPRQRHAQLGRSDTRPLDHRWTVHVRRAINAERPCMTRGATGHGSTKR